MVARSALRNNRLIRAPRPLFSRHLPSLAREHVCRREHRRGGRSDGHLYGAVRNRSSSLLLRTAALDDRDPSRVGIVVGPAHARSHGDRYRLADSL